MPVVFSNFRSIVCFSALLSPLSSLVFANIPAAYLACEGAEDRVAVVRTAASVEAIAHHHRCPGILVVIPSGHLRLLVEVAVDEHRVAVRARSRGRDLTRDERRASVDAVDVDGHAVDSTGLHGLLRKPSSGAER